MKYLSIIRFFEYCGIDYKKLNITQIKKVVSAEYSLSDNGIISINKLDYTKDFVLQEIDREDFQQRLDYHIIIWSNKALLNFLEKDVAGNNANVWYYLRENEGFRQFISPYMAYSIDKAMHKFLRNGDMAGASFLLDFLDFVDYVDENQALTSTRSFISDTLKLFKNTSKNNYRSNYSKLGVWTKKLAFHFINNLPDSLSEEREDLVIALINFTVEIQKKDRRFCFAVSENLTKVVDIDPQHTNLIKENHSVYKKNVSGGYRVWRYIKLGVIYLFFSRILLFIIVFLVGLVSKCTNGDDEKFTSDKDSPKTEYIDYSETAPRGFLGRLIARGNQIKKDREIREYRMFNIQYQDYMDIHDKYTEMLYDTTYIFVENESIPLIFDDLYYFMVENERSKEISSLCLVNKTGQDVIRYCITDFKDEALTFLILPQDSAFVEVHNSGFDIIASVYDYKKDELPKGITVRPVLLSDSINKSPHVIQTKHIDKDIHIDNPAKLYDFMIEFDSDSIYIRGKEGGKVDWIYPKL